MTPRMQISRDSTSGRHHDGFSLVDDSSYGAVDPNSLAVATDWADADATRDLAIAGQVISSYPSIPLLL